MKRIIFTTTLAGMLMFPMFIIGQQNVEISDRAVISVVKGKVISADKDEIVFVRSNEIASIPANRVFRAPVRRHDPVFSGYSIPSDATSTIFTPEGFVIKIEANSVVDPNGNEVRGSFQLFFRDLSKMSELVMSGVPMSYDSGGVSSVFQTAGMFEIYAEQNGNPLSLKQGNTISVSFPTLDSEEGYNLYYFNENDGQWKYAENLPEVQVMADPPQSITIYSNAYQYLYLLSGGGNSRIVDATSFNDRWLSPAYARYYLIDENLLQQHKISASDLRKADVYYFRLLRVSDKNNPKYSLFKIPHYSPSGQSHLNKIFPELRAVKHITWYYLGDLSKKDFYTQFIKGKMYVDARLEFDYTSGNFYIILKHLHGTSEIAAIPFRGKNTFTDQAYGQNKKLFERYQKFLRKAEDEFTKRTNVLKDKNGNDTLRLQSMMSPEELAMSWSEWEDYAKSVVSYNTAILNAQKQIQVTRNITLNGFGLVNCDRIYRMQAPVEMIAGFVLPNGSMVSSGTVIMIDGSENSCQILDGKNGKYNAVVEANTRTIFCVILHEKDVYLVNASVVSGSLLSGREVKYNLYSVGDHPADAIEQAMNL